MQGNAKVAMPSGMCNRTIQISQLRGNNQNIHTIYSLRSNRMRNMDKYANKQQKAYKQVGISTTRQYTKCTVLYISEALLI